MVPMSSAAKSAQKLFEQLISVDEISAPRVHNLDCKLIDKQILAHTLATCR